MRNEKIINSDFDLENYLQVCLALELNDSSYQSRVWRSCVKCHPLLLVSSVIPGLFPFPLLNPLDLTTPCRPQPASNWYKRSYPIMV